MIRSNFLVEYKKYYDDRGFISPILEKSILSGEDLCIKYSCSDLGVIRGFHWQKPPFLQEKYIYVLSGKIEDLICPVMQNKFILSKLERFTISSEDNLFIKIPSNYAHAYKAITKNTMVLYICKGKYNKENEITIKADSFFKL